jgi:glycosyltransferase involved in cell wall biosynthesis
MDHTGISFGMINCNGGQNLGDCLQSVAHLVDEMIVVDTGSSDDSPAIARSLGATVLFRKWPDSYSAARNIYVDAARLPYVLSLDSDEVLGPCTRDELDALLRVHPRCAFRFVIHNYFPADDSHKQLPSEVAKALPAGVGVSLSRTVRLFPRVPGVSYCYPVHELISPSLRRRGVGLRDAPWPIHHLGYVTGRERIPDKRRYYRQLGYRKIARHPNYYLGYFELAKLARAANETEEARTLLDRCLKLAPRFVDGLRFSALLALECKDWRRCAAYLQKGLVVQSGNVDLLYLFGLLEMQRGRTDRAISFFSTVIKRCPHHVPSQLRLVETLMSRGDYGTAGELLETMLMVQPTQVDVRLRLAEVAARLGRIDRVEQILAEALGDPATACKLRNAAARMEAGR